MAFKIGFVGLTHLSLISGAAALTKKNEVVFFDPNINLVKRLKERNYPIKEPGFEEVMIAYKPNITFTYEPGDIESCDIVYISPDIPTDDKGKSDLTSILELVDKVSPHWPKKGCVVILSQVQPGFTRKLAEKLKKQDIDTSRLFYQVETLVFGIAMQRALYPERYIVGISDKNQILSRNFIDYLESYGCPILPMIYESAEFCKICINVFLAASVSVSNTLEEICEKIGAKWSEIAPALKLDRRIGSYAYLSPGLGISGGNIERDLCSIITLSNKHATEASTVQGFIRNSYYRKDWPLRIFYETIMPKMKKFPKLGFLGIAYKENTHSIKNSPAVQLMSKLKTFDCFAYDPQVKELPLMLSDINISSTIEEVINQVEVLFVMTPWPIFRNISQEKFSKLKELKFVVDPYGLLKQVKFNKKVEYFSFC